MGLNPKGVIFMKKTLSIVLLVLLVFLAVACSPEHKHDYQLVESKTVKATCTSGGYDFMECSCGAIQSIPTGALGHDPVLKKTIASTCKVNGYNTYGCSRCTAQWSEDLPLDSENHPYKDEDDKGVAASLKDVKLAPTCGSDGLAVFTKCTLCGETGTFEVVIPKEYQKDVNSNGDHVVLNEDKKSVTEVTTADQIEEDGWVVKTTPTAFTARVRKATCPSCGEELSTPIDNVENYYDESTILGTWTYSKTDEHDATSSVLYTLTVSKEKGAYAVEAYYQNIVKGVVEAKKLNVSSAKFVSASDETGAPIAADYSGRTFRMTVGEDFYYLSEVTTDGTPTGSKKGDIILAAKYSGGGTLTPVVVKNSDHEHSFTLMEGIKAITTAGHYVECKECGLKNVLIEHGDDCACECGYDASSWYGVKITLDTLTDEYALPETEGISVAAATAAKPVTYYAFDGSSEKYSAVTSVRGLDGKGGTQTEATISANKNDGKYYPGTSTKYVEVSLEKCTP